MRGKNSTEGMKHTITNSRLNARNNFNGSSVQAGMQGKKRKIGVERSTVRKCSQLIEEKRDEQMERANIFNSSHLSPPALRKPSYSDIERNVTSKMDELRKPSQPQSLSVQIGQVESQHLTANPDFTSISIDLSAYKDLNQEVVALIVGQQKLCNALDALTERCETYKMEGNEAKMEAECMISSADWKEKRS